MAAPSDFSSLPDDVLSHRILTLLDRPTRGSLSLVSRRLHSLVLSSPTPWSIICSLTWPSTLSPLLLPVLPSFPNNPYLSFFLHSYPILASSLDPSHFPPPYRPRRLISAVDVRHRGEVVFSGAVETDTSSAWFARSPFTIHVVGPGEVFHTPLPELPDANTTDELTLSWILVDPEGRRAANLSCHSVLDISRYFIGEVHGRFFCVLGGKEGTAMELVKFEIVVIFVEDEDGNVWVKRLSMCAKDLEMKRLNGENSLEVLERGALGSTERRWKDRVSVARRRHDEFVHRSSKQQETMAGPRKVPRYFRIPRVGDQPPPGLM